MIVTAQIRSLTAGALSRCAFILVAAGAASTMACADEIVVRIDNFAFSPETVNAKVGDTIVWENEDDIPHSVVSKEIALRSRVMDTGERFSYTLKQAGAVGYFCGLHPHMKGNIVVQN